MEQVGALIGDAEVDHRGLDVAVAKPVLDIGRRPADFSQVNGDGVPEAVDVRAIRRQTRGRGVLVEQPVDLCARQRP